MRSFAICGHTQRGKSTFVRNLLTRFPDRPKYIYDINGEYSNAPLLQFKDFLNWVKNVRDSVIVIEEATVFVTNSSRIEDIRWMLVQKSPPHKNNIIIFNFHSLNSVPLEILNLIDFLILFKTNDRRDLIYKKFKYEPDIIQAFDHVDEMTLNVPEFLNDLNELGKPLKNPAFCYFDVVKRF